MNRRGFLSVLAAGMILDPERLLWRKGENPISIPQASQILKMAVDPGYPPPVSVMFCVDGLPYWTQTAEWRGLGRSK